MSVVRMHPSGLMVDLLNPTVDMIQMQDIIWHLSHICRYNGGVARFYSVAEHSVRVYRAAGSKAALLHDAVEAYVGDVVRPVKEILGSMWDEVERRIERVIEERFGVNISGEYAQWKPHDLAIGEQERKQLVVGGWGWSSKQAQLRFYEALVEAKIK